MQKRTILEDVPGGWCGTVNVLNSQDTKMSADEQIEPNRRGILKNEFPDMSRGNKSPENG